MQNPRHLARLLVLLALPCLPLSAATWTGAGDGWSWGNPENWSGGVLPVADETVWISPIAGEGWVEIGGVDGGGVVNLVIDSTGNLNLVLGAEARVGSVTTVNAGWHQLRGAAPEASSTWQVADGGGLTLNSLSEGAKLEKTGQGTLVIGSSASGAGRLRVVGLEGSVVVESASPLGLSDATLEALGGTFGFAGNVGRVGKLVIGEGSFGPMAGGGLVADQVVVSRQGHVDLADLPGITAEVLRIEGSSVQVSASLKAGRIVVAEAMLVPGLSILGGVVELDAGWIDGGVVGGELFVRGAAGRAGWSGSGVMAAGSRLTWIPEETEGVVLGVTGDLLLEPGSLVAIGEADWSNPFWDTTRRVTLVESWGGGITGAMPELEGGAYAGEGKWSLGADEFGGLALTWTAESRPVPEASATGWVTAAGLVALALRSRRGKRSPR